MSRGGISSLPFARRQRLRGAVGTKGVFRNLAFFAALCALASLHAWTRIEGTMAGYELSRAQVEHADLLREQKALKLELATRKGAKRIEADARGRLGMTEPAPDKIFAIERIP
ncbi:MAG TPA: cell division protein FtsL [Vulgatibacter sp.]